MSIPAVIIVEKNPDIRELLHLFLSGEKIPTLACEDAAQTLDASPAFTPGIVLTRVSSSDLPDCAGIRRIRASTAGEGLSVVVVVDERFGHGLVLRAGATEVVDLVDDFRQLPAILRRLLAGRDGRVEPPASAA
ncbi:MAG TPA: hypothetical protein VFD58_06855 [Blastocatellia bacterium]|nr:hypothetical protein [Blastocatellia bacterium]